MNLPGLNFDESKYPLTTVGSIEFRKIPFSDWLPPDHIDVICYSNKSAVSAYYSPASGLMVPSDFNQAGTAYEPESLDYWLKEVR